MNFLAEIVTRKLEDSLRLLEPGVAEAFKAEIARRPAPLSLKAALDGAAGPAIIAEIKRASPSKGDLALGWDPVELAQIYQENGAAVAKRARATKTPSRLAAKLLSALRGSTRKAPLGNSFI